MCQLCFLVSFDPFHLIPKGPSLEPVWEDGSPLIPHRLFSYNHSLLHNTYIPVLYRLDRQHWKWQTALFLWIIDSDESDNIPSYSSPCGSSPRCIAFKSASSSANSRSFASAASARPRTIS